MVTPGHKSDLLTASAPPWAAHKDQGWQITAQPLEGNHYIRVCVCVREVIDHHKAIKGWWVCVQSQTHTQTQSKHKRHDVWLIWMSTLPTDLSTYTHIYSMFFITCKSAPVWSHNFSTFALCLPTKWQKILLNRIYTRRNKMKPILKGVNEVSLQMAELTCFWMLDQHWLHPRKPSLAAPDWTSATCGRSVPEFQTKPKTV